MCHIERFHRIHPNGFREPRERILHCQYGTPNTPCNAARVVVALDEMFDPAINAAPAPHEQVIEPRFADRQRSPDHKKKPKKHRDDLKLVFDFHLPFTSHKKDRKAKKPKKDPRPDDGMGRPGYQEYIAVPPEHRHLPPHMGYPGPGMHPMPPPPPPPPQQGPRMNQPRGPVTPPITVCTNSSTNSSPSPLSPTREHNRRARSLSLTRQYEERKRIIRERERREHAERVALAEHAARLRADIEAERIREERDRERRRNEALRAEREAELISEERERERRRIDALRAREERRRQAEEERERLAQASLARRRREELDRRREAEALESERREAARRLRQREEEERIQEERDRLRRQREARIPRAPRHAAAVHHHHHHHHHDEHDGFEQEARVHFEDRGGEVINDAIRARQAEQQQQDRNHGVQPRWPVQGGPPRRRRTLGARERWVFDDDRRRWGDLGRRWL